MTDSRAKDCGCGKPKPGPLGGKPTGAPASLTASVSGKFTHVSPTGKRTAHNSALEARAAAVRSGGSVEYP